MEVYPLIDAHLNDSRQYFYLDGSLPGSQHAVVMLKLRRTSVSEQARIHSGHGPYAMTLPHSLPLDSHGFVLALPERMMLDVVQCANELLVPLKAGATVTVFVSVSAKGFKGLRHLR